MGWARPGSGVGEGRWNQHPQRLGQQHDLDRGGAAHLAVEVPRQGRVGVDTHLPGHHIGTVGKRPARPDHDLADGLAGHLQAAGVAEPVDDQQPVVHAGVTGDAPPSLRVALKAWWLARRRAAVSVYAPRPSTRLRRCGTAWATSTDSPMLAMLVNRSSPALARSTSATLPAARAATAPPTSSGRPRLRAKLLVVPSGSTPSAVSRWASRPASAVRLPSPPPKISRSGAGSSAWVSTWDSWAGSWTGKAAWTGRPAAASRADRPGQWRRPLRERVLTTSTTHHRRGWQPAAPAWNAPARSHPSHERLGTAPALTRPRGRCWPPERG